MTGFGKQKGFTKGISICGKRTICEVHRQLYDKLVLLLAKDNPKAWSEIKPLIEEAFGAGIKIIRKLVEYKISQPNWEKNLGIEEVKHIRKLRRQMERGLSDKEKT